MVEIRPADSSRLAHIAEVIGRAFVTEPMMAWRLSGRTDDLEERCIRFHGLFLAPLMGRGIIWESTDGHGALVLVPPQQDALDDAIAHVDDSRTQNVLHDGGRRYELGMGRIEDSVRAPLASRLRCGRTRLAGTRDRLRAHRVRA